MWHQLVLVHQKLLYWLQKDRFLADSLPTIDYKWPSNNWAISAGSSMNIHVAMTLYVAPWPSCTLHHENYVNGSHLVMFCCSQVLINFSIIIISYFNKINNLGCFCGTMIMQGWYHSINFIIIDFSYTLSREYRVARNRYSRLLFTSEDHFCPNLRVQEQSTNMM